MWIIWNFPCLEHIFRPLYLITCCCLCLEHLPPVSTSGVVVYLQVFLLHTSSLREGNYFFCIFKTQVLAQSVHWVDICIEHWCPIELSVVMEIFYICAVQSNSHKPGESNQGRRDELLWLGCRSHPNMRRYSKAPFLDGVIVPLARSFLQGQGRYGAARETEHVWVGEEKEHWRVTSWNKQKLNTAGGHATCFPDASLEAVPIISLQRRCLK